jgi:crotonobetainyl-CoA:carnitine CoA-transferase CaiB-like acyl-CoA transferase
MNRPLHGITVVALEQVIAGPFCTRQLAELGARVIKIERPGGGDAARDYDRTVKGQSSHFVWVNRSKESLALDVKHPQAQPVLEKLLQKADVFLQNLAPGAAERSASARPRCARSIPKLIWCGISGYGTGGPYAAKKAYDLLVQCEAGLLSVTGSADQPAKAGISVADIAGRHVRLILDPRGTVPAAGRGRGRDAGHHHVRVAGRMDGLPGLFHRLRRRGAAAHRRAPTPPSCPTGRSKPAMAGRCSCRCRTNASSSGFAKWFLRMQLCERTRDFPVDRKV